MSSRAARARRAPARRRKAAAKRFHDAQEQTRMRQRDRGAFLWKDGDTTRLMNRTERRQHGYVGPLHPDFAEQRDKQQRRRSSTVAEVQAKLARLARRVGIGGTVID